jgi:hypothetical protein
MECSFAASGTGRYPKSRALLQEPLVGSFVLWPEDGSKDEVARDGARQTCLESSLRDLHAKII